MRTTISKQKTNQLPNQVAADHKPTYLPFHTCKEQSPLCLVSTHSGPCLHDLCLKAYKKPQWWGISIGEFYNRQPFSEFDVMNSGYSEPHIIPHNPNRGAKDGFELFRQAMNAVLHLAGPWPLSHKTVLREHVEFRYKEFTDTYPVTCYETGSVEWRPRLNVHEYAYYVGPTEGLAMTFVDIDHKYPTREEILAAVKKGGSSDY